MLLVDGTLTLNPDRMEEAVPSITALVHASRAEIGCIDFVFSEEVGSPGTIRVFERWESRQHLDHHQATSHVAQWRKAAAELDIVRRSLVVYDHMGEPSEL